MAHLLGARVWHMLTRNHKFLPVIHTSINRWNQPCLSSFFSCNASQHCGPVSLRVGGWMAWRFKSW